MTKKVSIKALKKHFSWLKQAETVLKDRVRCSLIKAINSSASCIVADEDEMSVNLRRMLIEFKQSVPEMKPIRAEFKHPLMVRLKDEMQDERFADLANAFDSGNSSRGRSARRPFHLSMNDLVMTRFYMISLSLRSGLSGKE